MAVHSGEQLWLMGLWFQYLTFRRPVSRSPAVTTGPLSVARRCRGRCRELIYSLRLCLALNGDFLTCNFFSCSLRAFRSALTSAVLILRPSSESDASGFANPRICQFQHFLMLLDLPSDTLFMALSILSAFRLAKLHSISANLSPKEECRLRQNDGGKL